MVFQERFLTNDGLLTDSETADPRDGLALWWLGQSTFLVKSAAGRVLLDPYSTALPTRQPTKPGEPLMQQPRPAFDRSTLTSIDVVVSGQHSIDRIRAKYLAAVFDANPNTAFVVPELSRKAIAKQLGCDPPWPWGLRDGESVSFGEITVLAVPTDLNETDNKSAKFQDCRDYVVWFGDMKVYHGGNSRYHVATVEYLRPLAIDVALLPLEDRSAEHHSAGTLPDDEAAQLAHDIRARLAIPYYLTHVPDMPTASPTLFDETCHRLGQPYTSLHWGEGLSVSRK